MLTIQPEDGKQRVTGSWLASQELLENFSESLFNRGLGDHGTSDVPRVFGDLSNTEGLAMIDDYIVDIAKSYAEENKRNKDRAASDIITDAYVADNISIE